MLFRSIDQIFAVGGGVKNDLWMQIVADVTGKEIRIFLSRSRKKEFLEAFADYVGMEI